MNCSYVIITIFILSYFGPDPFVPILHTICESNDNLAIKVQKEFGFENYSSNWKDLVKNPEIDIIDINTPNYLHYEIAKLAIEEGKHIYCEKPLTNSYKTALELANLAEQKGIKTLVGFNYIQNPAHFLARNIIDEDKKIISIFSGSRSSEINVLMPILLKFIKMMKEKYNDIHFIFHTTSEHRATLKNQVSHEDLENCDVISDEKIKSYILKKSFFAVAKSGTISLEICNANVPSIIIYKINIIIGRSIAFATWAN